MSEKLAQFPLSLVVFPGEDIPLHIFEPRYRQLIHDCQERGCHFGITPVFDQKLQNLGTRMELVRIHKQYDNGKLDVVVRGLSVYEIRSFREIESGKLYSSAVVEERPTKGMPDPALQVRIDQLLEKIYSIMKIEQKNLPDERNPYALGHRVGFSLQEELQLLATSDIRKRQLMVVEKLESLIPHIRQMEKMREKVQMNGHFRFLTPPDFEI